jgi:hypothetical protein
MAPRAANTAISVAIDDLVTNATTQRELADKLHVTCAKARKQFRLAKRFH